MIIEAVGPNGITLFEYRTKKGPGFCDQIGSAVIVVRKMRALEQKCTLWS